MSSQQPPEVPRNLLALKSMVFGMAGLLVLAALILIGVGISRMGRSGFDAASIPLGPGCQLGAVTAAGDRLVIPVAGNDACRRIIIADLETGAIIGEFAFPPAE
ncbi:hypothetical protein A8950_3023 [Dongia mobilis]|uniref:Uncharacterized protein n=1 Tax=Dongia mobilis TaxID=578943 RepID=A0A4R6WJC6_9PROT|nr:hypothetical protein [Dongia mobilis]TDQ80492.1 hypothetical protein A8950_3023 [Dongia mobilis]